MVTSHLITQVKELNLTEKISDHYKTLRVSRDAPTEVIFASYKALSEKYRPDQQDKQLSDPASGWCYMKTLLDACDVLTNTQKRAEYDLILRQQETTEKAEENEKEILALQTATAQQPPELEETPLLDDRGWNRLNFMERLNSLDWSSKDSFAVLWIGILFAGGIMAVALDDSPTASISHVSNYSNNSVSQQTQQPTVQQQQNLQLERQWQYRQQLVEQGRLEEARYQQYQQQLLAEWKQEALSYNRWWNQVASARQYGDGTGHNAYQQRWYQLRNDSTQEHQQYQRNLAALLKSVQDKQQEVQQWTAQKYQPRFTTSKQTEEPSILDRIILFTDELRYPVLRR